MLGKKDSHLAVLIHLLHYITTPQIFKVLFTLIKGVLKGKLRCGFMKDNVSL